MEIPDDLLCLFSARVEERGGSYVIEVPEGELTYGDVDGGQTYRIAVFAGSSPAPDVESRPGAPGPPVEEGEVREVEIENLGDQGDGIARVERGYVIIVPGADVGERVTVEITTVAENYAIGEVIEPIE